MSIPKIIHQLWIGSKPAPTKFMNTWKEKHAGLGFEYIFWNEEELKKRGMSLTLGEKINSMEEINGKADIIRWEILERYGGVFVDADSICIEPVDDTLMKCKAGCFAGYEQEQIRKGLIATGTMGFPPNHLIVKRCIKWIRENPVSTALTQQRAWYTVGPGLLTRIVNDYKMHNQITVFPSYYFLPRHYSGIEYKGHEKVYAYQEWGSTKQNYDSMNQLSLPKEFSKPAKSVSVLVSSLNTKATFIKDCLDSIKSQIGLFNIELVWINDGSDKLHTMLLKKQLDNFKNTTRFVDVVYKENDGNKGIGYTLHHGVLMCSNEIIIKMDSDDIMIPDRIIKQMKFMENNPNIHICGGQIKMFHGDKANIVDITRLPTIQWSDFRQQPQHWFVNHPTVCYRKSSILAAGNYNPELKKMAEDFNLELRMLKMFDVVYNFPEPLLYYRLHEGQITHQGGSEGREYWSDIRNKMIMEMISNN
jgi:mannosyltransferase OCH1-like enzyme